MFRIFDSSAPRASENFYRNIFALMAFTAFAVAIASDSSAAFASTLVFGALSRAAVKKNWKTPDFAKRNPFFAVTKKTDD
jgi:mannose/cellobiose epimerase-like protein (N-acyl-D-glucosamine 2-epimerase family)